MLLFLTVLFTIALGDNCTNNIDLSLNWRSEQFSLNDFSLNLLGVDENGLVFSSNQAFQPKLQQFVKLSFVSSDTFWHTTAPAPIFESSTVQSNQMVYGYAEQPMLNASLLFELDTMSGEWNNITLKLSVPQLPYTYTSNFTTTGATFCKKLGMLLVLIAPSCQYCDGAFLAGIVIGLFVLLAISFDAVLEDSI